MRIGNTALLTIALALASCGNTENDKIWTASDGHFVRNGSEPYYFIGTNMWYAPLLLSDTEYADPERLYRELDSLKSAGITNLRVLVGADGKDGVKAKVEPALQTAPGVYDERVFRGLDRFLAELDKRDMSAVLYLTNAWEWSGGFGQYLEWAGMGKAKSTVDTPWPEYCDFTSRFSVNDSAKTMFANHVRTVVSRTNTVTGKPYKEDPAIFSWQICNEPRCFVSSDSVKTEFTKWLHSTAALIKSIDSNHMVSTGNEGTYGCEMDRDLYMKIHSSPDIDYLTIHIWPLNWSWVNKDSLAGDLGNAIERTEEYIKEHVAMAEELGKPLVIEEFGFPRDGFEFRKGTPVTCRDRYYSCLIDKLTASRKSGSVLCGLNFWTWGGVARQAPDHIYWVRGDDYCGDPAQEQQGLNSVYLDDTTTMDLLKAAIEKLDNNYTD